MKRKIVWWQLLISIMIPLAVGGLSAFLSHEGMDKYELMDKPPLSPPEIVFPIVWTVLYILIGISSYLVWLCGGDERKLPLILYAVQLAYNFMWTIFFFNFAFYGFAFFWLLLLLFLVVLMTICFGKIDKLAGNLQIPYIIWLIFAGYLNLAVKLMY